MFVKFILFYCKIRFFLCAYNSLSTLSTFPLVTILFQYLVSAFSAQIRSLLLYFG